MKLLQRAQSITSYVKELVAPSPDLLAEEYHEIREELIEVRTQLVLLNKSYDGTDPEFHESVSQEINSAKEREHALIKQAKRLMGQRINIETSLREYNQSQDEVSPTPGSRLPE